MFSLMNSDFSTHKHRKDNLMEYRSLHGGNQRDVRPLKVISINLCNPCYIKKISILFFRNHDYYIILTIFYH